MKKIIAPLFVIAFLAMTGCSHFVSRRTLLKQNDSLYVAIANKADTLAMIKGSFELIMNSFDSIYYQQTALFMPDEANPAGSFSKSELNTKLDSYQDIVDRQRARIDSLELTLMSEDVHLSSLSRLIGYLRDDIDSKEAEIGRMRTEIAANQNQMAKLNQKVQTMSTRVVTMNEQINHLEEENLQQQNALNEKDMALHEGYVYVASQKEMMKNGINNIFKKDLSKIDLSKAKKVDIREFTELEIPSRNPKVLSSMPTASYRLEKNANSCTLMILNPTEFWSQSKVLVIQYVQL